MYKGASTNVNIIHITHLFYFMSNRLCHDRQYRVPCAGFDLKKKLKESTTWLQKGTLMALRNRAQSLCQVFSISRTDEGVSWEFADLWPLKYPQELPAVGPQAMDTIYVVQQEHKTRAVRNKIKIGPTQGFPTVSHVTAYKDVIVDQNGVCDVSRMICQRIGSFLCGTGTIGSAQWDHLPCTSSIDSMWVVNNSHSWLARKKNGMNKFIHHCSCWWIEGSLLCVLDSHISVCHTFLQFSHMTFFL